MVETKGTLLHTAIEGNIESNPAEAQTQNASLQEIPKTASRDELIEINEKEEEEEEKTIRIPDDDPSQLMQNVGQVLTEEPLQTDDLAQEERDQIKMLTEDSLMSQFQQPGTHGMPSGEMPSDDDLETYRIVFELFDRDRSGFIDNHDLAAISVKLGKDPSEGKSS